MDAPDQRDETPLEELDRNTIELLNELRVAGTGILVLLSDFVVGGAAPIVVGVLTAALLGSLWFALPLVKRAREPRP
jgi:hypothetical protein